MQKWYTNYNYVIMGLIVFTVSEKKKGKLAVKKLRTQFHNYILVILTFAPNRPSNFSDLLTLQTKYLKKS